MTTGDLSIPKQATNGDANAYAPELLSTPKIQSLDVAEMQLFGRHIIEASAGTGKTYNITRIVIRLLLEQRVELKNVLIVTFTKAATQELKGRIAKEINLLLHHLENNPDKIDKLFKTFISNIKLESDQDKNEPEASSQEQAGGDKAEGTESIYDLKLNHAKLRLKAASLSLDEASIFTIHSFCQRVLKQSAFMRQKSFSFDLINKSEPYYMQAIQDFFRKYSNNDSILNALEFLKIKSPNEFYHYFYNAFESTDLVECPIAVCDQNSEESIKNTTASLVELSNQILMLKNQAIDQFFQHYATSIKILNDFIFEKEIQFRQSIRENSTPNSVAKQQKDLTLAIAFFRDMSYEDVPTRSSLATLVQQKKLLPCFASKSEAKPLSDATKGLLEGIDKLNKELKAFDTTEKNQLEDMRLKLRGKHFQLMVSCINEIKANAAKAKQMREVIDHNDTIVELSDAVQSSNDNVIKYIQDSFPFALIDEFQDTDSLQYSIFSTCYPSQGKNLLLMIGDPKQAIYAFRGSDINTYINARDEADFVWSMQSNFRSSQSMIDAYNVLFYGASVNKQSLHELKTHFQKNASNLEQLNRSSLFGNVIDYSWIFKGEGIDVSPFKDKTNGSICFQINADVWPISKGNNQFKEEQAYAVAHEIIRLTGEATIEDKPVQPKDIAILIPGKSEAATIKKVLDESNIPCVFLSEKSNVFLSEEAKSTFYALDGILHLNDNRKFMRALSSELFGLNIQDLFKVQSDIVKFDQLKQQFASLKQIWLKDGVLVMLTQLLKTQFNTNRVNQTKERILTNYNHIAELLNEQSKVSEHAYQLLTWLKKQLPSTGVDIEEPQETENEQRLESDDALVKLVTLHGSKGLEYPIVFIPYAGFSKPSRTQQLFKYHDKTRKINVISLGGTSEIKEISDQQSFEEDMRLLYVGITRAVYKCYLGVGKPTSLAKTPLARMIECQSNESQSPIDIIESITRQEPELFSINAFNNSIQAKSNASTNQLAEVQTSIFKGNTSQRWQLASFSYIAKQTVHHNSPSFIDMTKRDRDEDATLPAEETHITVPLEYRFTMEKSADTGTLLHNLLEDHDFTKALIIANDNPHVRFYEHSERECKLRELEQWLNDVLSTPIPNIHKPTDFQLSKLKSTRVLKEPEFYFPILDCNSYQLNKLINTHRQSTGGAKQQANNLVTLEDVNDLISDLSISSLTGMMHGFIDLLFEFDGKYYVADYKSNYLGDKPSDYLGASLRKAIQSHLYDLQYLIYSWALDRYLDQRIQHYSRDTHFGGVYYFFLRGMSTSFPLGSGIFSTRVDDDTWELLDETLGKALRGFEL